MIELSLVLDAFFNPNFTAILGMVLDFLASLR